MKSKFRKIVYILCICIMFASILFITRTQYIEYKEKQLIKQQQEEQNKEEERLREELQTVNNVEVESETVTVQEEEQLEILPKYEQKYKENNDFYGWIEIEDTNIDYPVMYTPQNPNFYINRNFIKNESELGSIYIDGSNSPNSDNNIIIYGHNRKDLSMFGYLSYYKQEDFYQAHKCIRFDTIYEEAKYEIIAVSQAFIREEDLMAGNDSKIPFKEVDDYMFYKHLKLGTEKEFNEYVTYMKEHSYYEIETTANYGDKLITLCTCTNIKQYQNERLLIVAKKIE